MGLWSYFFSALTPFVAIGITFAFDGGFWFWLVTALIIMLIIGVIDELLDDRRKAREQAAEAAAKAARAEEMKEAVREVLAEGGDTTKADQKPAS